MPGRSTLWRIECGGGGELRLVRLSIRRSGVCVANLIIMPAPGDVEHAKNQQTNLTLAAVAVAAASSSGERGRAFAIDTKAS